MTDYEDPFATPTSAESGGGIAEHKGELLIVWAREHQTGLTTKFCKPGETKDALRCDFAVLTGENAGTLEEDALIFQGQLIASLKRLAKRNFKVEGDDGDASRDKLRPFLGRVGQGTDKSKGNVPWIFLDPTDADKALAIEWLAKNKPVEEPPF